MRWTKETWHQTLFTLYPCEPFTPCELRMDINSQHSLKHPSAVPR